MSPLKILKLSNGDDIIGFIEIEAKNISDNLTQKELEEMNTTFVRGALKIEKKYIQKSQKFNLNLIDWTPESDDNLIPISNTNIISIVTPSNDVEKFYYTLALNAMNEQNENSTQEQENVKTLLEHKFNKDEIH